MKTGRYEWPEPREGQERLVCPRCGSPHLIEVTSGWERLAVHVYDSGDYVDTDSGLGLKSDTSDLWYQCGDCNAEFWDDGESLVSESEWKGGS